MISCSIFLLKLEIVTGSFSQNRRFSALELVDFDQKLSIFTFFWGKSVFGIAHFFRSFLVQIRCHVIVPAGSKFNNMLLVPKFNGTKVSLTLNKNMFLEICLILFDQDQIIWNWSKTYLDYKEWKLIMEHLVQNSIWLFLIKIVDFDQYFDCVTCYGFNYFEPKRSLKKCSSTRRRGLFWKSIRSNFSLKIPIYRIFLTKFYGFENI